MPLSRGPRGAPSVGLLSRGRAIPARHRFSGEDVGRQLLRQLGVVLHRRRGHHHRRPDQRLLVAKAQVNSFIATIGTAALLGALVLAYSGGIVIFEIAG